MEKTYVMPDDKAQELKETIEIDIEKGIYDNFKSVGLVLFSILRAIQDRLPFTYEQDCTLRANGYTKGTVATWYYPTWNTQWQIIRERK